MFSKRSTSGLYEERKLSSYPAINIHHNIQCIFVPAPPPCSGMGSCYVSMQYARQCDVYLSEVLLLLSIYDGAMLRNEIDNCKYRFLVEKAVNIGFIIE